MGREPVRPVIERWKVNLIRARAVRLGFRGADLEDLQQEILPHVMAFQFCRSRANGAAESTALIALIDRRLFMALRGNYRYQQRLDRVRARLGANERPGEKTEPCYEERVGLKAEVGEVVARLSPADRDLCNALADGQSINVIAGRLGCGWHRVKRRMAKIREHFEALGLDDWLR